MNSRTAGVLRGTASQYPRLARPDDRPATWSPSPANLATTAPPQSKHRRRHLRSYRLGRRPGLASADASASASLGASERDPTVTSRAWKSSQASAHARSSQTPAWPCSEVLYVTVSAKRAAQPLSDG